MSAPYYQDDAVTLYHGDYREALAGMEDASVDAVITDPPYTDRTHGMCPARRWNKWGWLAHRCTWLQDHGGTRHHDTHTGAIWSDK